MAQETFSVNGPHNKIHNYYAFIHATIYKDYQTILQNGTLLIKDGKVVGIGENKKVTIPANTVVYDLKGKYIYPSLIDIYTDYGVPHKVKSTKPHLSPQFNSNNKGAFDWNQAIHPEVEAGKLFKVDDKKANIFIHHLKIKCDISGGI